MKTFTSLLMLAAFCASVCLSGIQCGAEGEKPLIVSAKVRPDSAWRDFETTTIEHLTAYQPKPDREYSIYGGIADRIEEATGFFYPKKIGDRWWLIDPEGHPFIHKAVVNIRPGGSDIEKDALKNKFGAPETWAEKMTRLLQDNGFNGAGAWSTAELIKSVPDPLVYTNILNFMSRYGYERGGAFQQPGHTGFPKDLIFVFEPEFESFCDREARSIAEFKDEKSLLGYFSDNELPWPNDALDRSLTLDKNTSGYQAAKKWLDERKGKDAGPADISNEDRLEFVAFMADSYFSICARAIKKYDPNHLYLGSRFHGRTRELKNEAFLETAGKYLDIISVNYYATWTPVRETLANWSQSSGRPILITEWYVKGEDSGLPNTTGAGWIVKTQKDRGYFYQNYVLALLKSKVCVGWHWFKYQDNDPTEPNMDPSNRDSNKGVVNNRFEPYTDLLGEMKELNTQVYSLIDYFDSRD